MRPSATKAAVDALLVDVCRGDDVDVPAGVGDSDELLLAGARFHRVAPLTYVTLRDRARSPVAETLRADRDKAWWHHLRVTAVLDQLAGILDGLDWLVFKGPVLSELAHPIPGLRSYKDLDILIAPSQLRNAVDRLFAAGWTVIQSNDEMENPEVPGEVPLASPAGVLLDLHWSMVITNTRRRLYPVDTEALLARRVPVKIGTSELSTLDPRDMLVHVCHHAALTGATRLGHVLDADQLARQATDWDRIAATAREWGATAHVALVLDRARRLFGTPIPARLPNMLGVSIGFRPLTSVVDHLTPISSLRRDGSWPRLIASVAQPSGVRTFGAMMRQGAMIMIDRTRPRRAAQPRIPASDEAIEHYLAAVEDVMRHATVTR